MSIIKLFKITCKTNLHVGSGENELNLVENSVQRDSITKFPIINSSSLKGAIREYFKNNEKNDEKNKVNSYFGSETEGRGRIIFFDAKLFAYPFVSNTYGKNYAMKTCDQITMELEEMYKLLIKNNKDIDDIDDKIIKCQYMKILEKNCKEDLEKCKKVFEKCKEDFEKNYKETLENFKEVVNELPVIARNHLENGLSKNLWYEEFVPRETIFYTFFSEIDNNNNKESLIKYFSEEINNKIIQIGANATIGYGYCLFEEVK